VELPNGDRIWAGNGSLRDEFLNKGRIANGDDVELNINEEMNGFDAEDAVDSITDSDTDKDLDQPTAPLPSKKEISKKKPVETPKELKRKADVDLNKVENKKAKDVSAMLWEGKSISEWLSIAAGIRKEAVGKNKKWHYSHLPPVGIDHHIKTILQNRIENEDVFFPLWANLKSRRICGSCLCFKADFKGGNLANHHPKMCSKVCCGIHKCRKCLHAHDKTTPCVCTCWSDVVTALNIGPEPSSSLEEAEGKTWKGKALKDYLLIADDIVEEELKATPQEDHQPLSDLHGHLRIWINNAAQGRYFNFWTHILRNKLCIGCCDMEGEAGGDSLVHLHQRHAIADCVEKCCGKFLCKLCLHKHAHDTKCTCECMIKVVKTIKLELPDVKVQTETKNRYLNLQKAKEERKEKQENILSEISDW